MNRHSILVFITAVLALALAACSSLSTPAASPPASAPAAATPIPTAQSSSIVKTGAGAAAQPTVKYTLITGGKVGGLVFVGVGGDIDGAVNPTLKANPGDTVEITLENGDGVLHDLTLDEFAVKAGPIQTQGDKRTVTFRVDKAGEYVYYCAQPGHRQAGMWGTLQVGEVAPVAAQGADIVRSPADLPAPVGDRGPQLVRVDLTAQEIVGQLADGTTYPYYTFNGKVPGPMIRVRVDDTVELHLTNAISNTMAHSIDLHAVTGPGGGAVLMQTKPGQENVFTFKALKPGVYVYHCATPSVPHHIASGMYGLIVVEPAGGLAPVDREYYVMQGEIYTKQPYGTKGALVFDETKLANETPEYFVFNGAAGALTADANALQASVGQTVRVFFGVGGPNFTSSFHIIGEMFDKVYEYGSLASTPLVDVQTVSVPPGAATMVELKVEVPGTYILVDHALSRLERGLAGYLKVDGPDQPDIYHAGPATPQP